MVCNFVYLEKFDIYDTIKIINYQRKGSFMLDLILITELINRILEEYGRVGLIYTLLFHFAGIGFIIWFIRQLPEQEELFEQTKCEGCKYRYPVKNTFIIDCGYFEKAVRFQRHYQACPHEADIDEDMKLKDTSSPRVVKNPKFVPRKSAVDYYLEMLEEQDSDL